MSDRTAYPRGRSDLPATSAGEALSSLLRSTAQAVPGAQQRGMRLAARGGEEFTALMVLRRRVARPIELEDASDDEPPLAPAALLDAILADATLAGATHVHVESRRDRLSVRYRDHGALSEQVQLGGRTAIGLRDHLTRIVAGSGVVRLNLDRPGRAEPETAPFTVLKVETTQGPRFVLARPGGGLVASTLAPLGLGPVPRRIVQGALSERAGLMLVAGQTGSGRRATVRAMLTALADGGRSVLAVSGEGGGRRAEIMDVVAPAAASAIQRAEMLRDLLRQDPDVLALDLLDDRATAEAAVSAALGGRLVIARIDAPDAMGAVARLKTLRIDSFAIASALRLVIAQRLAARLCPACRQPVQARASTSALLGFDPGAIVYQADGCVACNDTGFAGRVGVFEVVDVDQTIRRLINSGGDAAILARHAFLNAPNMGSAARSMVREGVITAEEAVRLSRSEPATV